jgi:hypothetical protein
MTRFSRGGRSGEAKALLRRARDKEKRPRLPDLDELGETLVRAAGVLNTLPQEVRPASLSGKPGGLLYLPKDIPVLILPDLHTRVGLLRRALEWIPPDEEEPLVDLLVSGRALLLLLGDLFHSEGPDAPRRWVEAYREYLSGFLYHVSMDREMALCLGGLDVLARAILLAPGRVLCLKGNHDNSRNREGEGDHGFYKFADEGAMCAAWMDGFAEPPFRQALADFEDSLPLAAIGKRFMASHAEPAFALTPDDVTERLPATVEALTWTDNDQAEPGSVAESLRAFLGANADGVRWIAGHRPVEGHYALRSGGALVQIHAPFTLQGAWMVPDRPFDPETDIRRL